MGENRLRALELFRAPAGKGDGYGAFNAAVIQLEAANSSGRGERIRLLTQAADSGIVGAAAKSGDELPALTTLT
ncbi:hypothetical protein ACIP98_37930 [Streptomyces sp. NPDC088354]|uniref:hypothetical protein n=1 Tax=Streptomyces sp. NPDC088354 TaxID=3365856 RepID=UPI00380CDEA0